MSQSNSAFGAQDPKGTARSRRVQHANQTNATDDTVEPACRARKIGRGVERREWRETPYDTRTLAFYEPCEWCFPDGAPDENEVEIVVRSCRKPTSYHRPRDSNESTGHVGNHDAIRSVETICSLTDLRKGQQVIWENRAHPLRVVETTNEPNGTVTLRGHNEGKYQIEGRPQHSQPYYITNYGYRSEVVRVRADDRQEAA